MCSLPIDRRPGLHLGCPAYPVTRPLSGTAACLIAARLPPAGRGDGARGGGGGPPWDDVEDFHFFAVCLGSRTRLPGRRWANGSSGTRLYVLNWRQRRALGCGGYVPAAPYRSVFLLPRCRRRPCSLPASRSTVVTRLAPRPPAAARGPSRPHGLSTRCTSCSAAAGRPVLRRCIFDPCAFCRRIRDPMPIIERVLRRSTQETHTTYARNNATTLHRRNLLSIVLWRQR